MPKKDIADPRVSERYLLSIAAKAGEIVPMEETQHKDIYLSDDQYMEILIKIRDIVTKPGFKPSGCDSNYIGDKSTTTNCGMCNHNDLTTKENSMWPEEFPQRKVMKYAKNHQSCPFDMREKPSRSGCFYDCYVFGNGKGKRKGPRDINFMITRAHEKIGEANAKQRTSKS